MGADEKHAATYHGGEYTPDLDDLRDLWVDSKLDHLPRAVGIPLVPTVQAEFNRWLETVRAEAKAEALLETAADTEASAKEYAKTSLDLTGDDNTRYAAYANMGNAIACRLRNRAEQYKEEQ